MKRKPPCGHPDSDFRLYTLPGRQAKQRRCLACKRLAWKKKFGQEPPPPPKPEVPAYVWLELASKRWAA